MSDIRFRRLERRGARRVGSRLELSMQLPKTPSGMEMRRCPRDECEPGLFQLGEVTVTADVAEAPDHEPSRQPHSAGTTCPYCGQDSDDDHDFIDPRDLSELTEWFKWAAGEDAMDAVTDVFTNFGRSLPRGGPISFKASTRRRQRPEPRIWRQDLLRDLTCTTCGRRYGVYAIALFCPDCGVPNLTVHFRRECDLIAQQVEPAESAGNPELGFRLLGNAHEDVVTALETYLKTAYRHVVGRRLPEADAARLRSARSIGNTFQNIERSQERFRALALDPFSGLDAGELEALRINIEKRHVIGHNLGLSDERYAETTTTALPGQTVVLLADEVRRFAALAMRVVGTVESQMFSSAALDGADAEAMSGQDGSMVDA